MMSEGMGVMPGSDSDAPGTVLFDASKNEIFTLSSGKFMPLLLYLQL
jgi:hypothetical protein